MPPVNDNFAAATLIAGSYGSASGTNIGATQETGEPARYAGSGTKNSVWWKWVAPSSGAFSFRTVGSAFDTVLDVLTGPDLVSLTRVVGNDDFGGDATSQVTFTATAGTTYYVRVMGFSSTEHGAISLAWTSGSTFPVFPTITSVSPTEGPAGTEVTVTGTHLDTITAVRFGSAAAASLTIDSSTQLRAVVPVTHTPSDTLTVDSGSASADATFTVLFPGPWIQPVDADTSAIRLVWGAEVQQTFGYTDPPPAYPDASAVFTDDGSPAEWVIAWDGASSLWTRTVAVGLAGIDIDWQFTNEPDTLFPPVPPTFAEIIAAGAESYTLEHPAGAPRDAATISLHSLTAKSTHDIGGPPTSTPPAATAVDAATVKVYRLPASWYTWDRLSVPANPHPHLDRWHVGSEIAALTHYADLPVSDGTGLVADAPTPTRFWAGSPGFTSTDLDVPISLSTDVDADGGFVLLLAVDMLIDEATPPLPSLDDGFGNVTAIASEAAATQRWGDQRVSLVMTYQPPRYRFLYTSPQGRPPLGHRQRRDGTATVGPSLAHFQGADGATRPPLAHRQNTP